MWAGAADSGTGAADSGKEVADTGAGCWGEGPSVRSRIGPKSRSAEVVPGQYPIMAEPIAEPIVIRDDDEVIVICGDDVPDTGCLQKYAGEPATRAGEPATRPEIPCFEAAFFDVAPRPASPQPVSPAPVIRSELPRVQGVEEHIGRIAGMTIINFLKLSSYIITPP